ncbi:MerR family DNA-binding transcriptional regulator [Pseudocitrobacter corydidari]
MEIRIGDLAKRSGCEVVTIRYYEKEGLLQKPARSGGNFRLYGEAHIEGYAWKTESMVTPVFATPILTTSWLA